MKVEISIGELVDKVTILEIKLDKINDKEKLKNIEKEYRLLKHKMNEIGIPNFSKEYMELKKINLKLWGIEDNIRIKESKNEFDNEFIQLARDVYYKNDIRSTIKRDINLKFNSELIEEKEYIDYKN